MQSRPESVVPADRESSAAAPYVLAAGLAGLVAGHLLVFRVELVHVNFYVVAWWSFIVALEGWNGMRGRALFLDRGLRWFLEVCGWSAFLWFVFEFYNFWLGNWYYTGLPSNPYWRWLATFVAFATVLPGMWEVEEAIWQLLPEGFDDGEEWELSNFTLGFVGLVAVVGTVGPFVYPTWTFPLVWGGLLAAVDLLEARSGGPSFIRQVESGQYRGLVAWLAAGAVCGFAWEFWNSFAGAKWIYTVPGFGEWRLFEMPVPGFLGFVPFAAMTWRLFEAVYRRYEAAGPAAKAGLWVAAGAFSVAVRWGMVDITSGAKYPADITEFSGWSAQQRTLLEDRHAQTPFEARKIDDPEIQRKLEYLEFGGIWVDTGDCLWASNLRTIDAIKGAPVPLLTEIATNCHPGPDSFWRRRVLDWKQRPHPGR